MTRIPMSRPDVSEGDVEAVVRVLRTPVLSLGPRATEFERAIAQVVGVPNVVAAASGTGALHCALLATGCRDGDIVLTTPFSFIASTNVILYERAIPVFVDVDPLTGNVDPEGLKATLADLESDRRVSRLPPQTAADTSEGRIAAVLPVHVFGQPADMDAIAGAAATVGAAVIEDACEALGSRYKDRPAGGLGDVGVFAFYPNKQITTGEGGAVVARSSDVADEVRSLINQGRGTGQEWTEHARLGFNYRMDELRAALGCSQIARLEAIVESRARVAAWYTERIESIPEVRAPHIAPTTTLMSWFCYTVRFPDNFARNLASEYLGARGIPSRVYFHPIHLQPFYIRRFGYERGMFPNAEAWGDTALSLPFSGVMSEADVDEVCRSIAEAFA